MAPTVIATTRSSTFGIARRFRRKTSLRSRSNIVLHPFLGARFDVGTAAGRRAGQLEEDVLQARAAAHDLGGEDALIGEGAVDVGSAFRRGIDLNSPPVDGDAFDIWRLAQDRGCPNG